LYISNPIQKNLNASLIAHLETLPIEHLQTHLAAYPWFTAARVVLAKKNREVETLQSAAVYVQDRAWFKMYYEAQPAKDFSEKIIEEAFAVEAVEIETEVVVEQPELVIDIVPETIPVDELKPQEVLVEAQFEVSIEEEPIEVIEEEIPLQPKSFSDWLQQFSVSKDGKVTVAAAKNARTVEKDELEELIQSNIPYEMIETKLDAETHYSKGLQSFINEQKIIKNATVAVPLFDENTHLPITETFAKLLVGQQKYKQAIVIYEKLSLKFPSKSTYFAALIKETEEKI
jgi:hypothetical protein